MNVETLRAQGERELAEKIRAHADVKKAMEVATKEAQKGGARRHLLATAMRLTPEMAPDIASILDETQAALGLDAAIETYVYPSPNYNAAAVRPEDGRLFVMYSSSLLEAFSADELRFVVGHELGHHLFHHHDIPTGLLLNPKSPVGPSLALQLFAWQRYAEVSCDRAGVVAAGGLRPAATALFELASGLSSDKVEVRVDHFLSQLGDLRKEADRLDRADSPARSDWFSTHPFSPLRLRAAELFVASELAPQPVDEPMNVATLEAEVHELMTLMDPSYLQSKTEVAEAMRRLLFAGGIGVAAASGDVTEPERDTLEELLGDGSLPREIDPVAVGNALAKRVAKVREIVPSLRRVQIIRDLCLVAGADGTVSDAERAVIDDIAGAIDVDGASVEHFIRDLSRVSKTTQVSD